MNHLLEISIKPQLSLGQQLPSPSPLHGSALYNCTALDLLINCAACNCGEVEAHSKCQLSMSNSVLPKAIMHSTEAHPLALPTLESAHQAVYLNHLSHSRTNLGGNTKPCEKATCNALQPEGF